MSLPQNAHKNEPPLPEYRELTTSGSMYVEIPKGSITLTLSGTSMGREVNVDAIRVLEKQIEEGKGDTITLKRARNLLLNISARVPPEILGDVFAWCLVPEASYSIHSQSHFKGFQKGSYNFLLVCHHWFQVASRTPELWSFWGNTLQDWKKYHHRWAGVAPLDLVLDRDGRDAHVLFDGSLQDAIRIGVMRDTIRRIHLKSNNGAILSSIISSLTPNDKSAQNENIESIVWRTYSSPIDVSNFFARSRLSKLCFLWLHGNLRISSWDRLASRATLLTTLSLEIFDCSPPPVKPTIFQLFSILASNPNLRELSLTEAALPEDADRSTLQVPLHHLSILSLSGEFRRLFGLLRQLKFPGTLDEMYLTGLNLTVEGISQNLGPYMRDYFRRGIAFQDRLEVSPYSSVNVISISIIVACPQITALTPRVTISAISDGPPPPDVLERMFINLIVPIPRECVVSFVANTSQKLPEELYFTMPNIEKAHLFGVELSEGFLQPNPDGPHANTQLFPSLRSLCLEGVKTDDSNWGHLITYLVHQTSGGQMVSLEVIGDSPCMPPEVVNEVEGLVEEFTYRSNSAVDL